MKKFVLLYFLLSPLFCMSQIVGEWEMINPDYKWEEIYQHYGDVLEYNIDNRVEKYLIRETINLFVDNVLIKFNADKSMSIKTLENIYFGTWKQFSFGLYVTVEINNTKVYFDLFNHDKLNHTLMIKSTNKDYIRIEENYLNDRVRIKKIILM